MFYNEKFRYERFNEETGEDESYHVTITAFRPRQKKSPFEELNEMLEKGEFELISASMSHPIVGKLDVTDRLEVALEDPERVEISLKKGELMLRANWEELSDNFYVCGYGFVIRGDSDYKGCTSGADIVYQLSLLKGEIEQAIENYYEWGEEIPEKLQSMLNCAENSV